MFSWFAQMLGIDVVRWKDYLWAEMTDSVLNQRLLATVSWTMTGCRNGGRRMRRWLVGWVEWGLLIDPSLTNDFRCVAACQRYSHATLHCKKISEELKSPSPFLPLSVSFPFPCKYAAARQQTFRGLVLKPFDRLWHCGHLSSLVLLVRQCSSSGSSKDGQTFCHCHTDYHADIQVPDMFGVDEYHRWRRGRGSNCPP